MTAHIAAGTGDVGALAAVLEAGESVDSRDANGWTALMAAAWCGQEDCVKLLVDAGASLSAKCCGDTALTLAEAKAHHACTSILQAARQAARTGAGGDQAEEGQVRSCKRLIQILQPGVAVGAVKEALAEVGAGVNTVVDGTTPLLRAIESATDPAIVQALLAAGAVAGTCVKGAPSTPLHAAASAGRLETLQLLLSSAGEDHVDSRDSLKRTPALGR